MNKKSFFAPLLVCGIVFLLSFSTAAQKNPEPKEVLGFTPGDDYKLAYWADIVGYFKKLDAASDRVIFKEIGKTTEGKPFTYAVISSPKNLKNLDKYIKINDQLADPRMIKRSDKKARKLINKGKTFVLITLGIHSTEVASTLSSTLIAHKLASSKEERIKKILDETIVVLVPSLNPDGVDIVKKWYDKTLGTKFEGTSPPELYQKYVGHDNNRDWYAFTQVETQLTVEKIHNVFHPQIVHDIHQQGRNGARFFVPPYLDPVEPNVPKEIVEGYTEMGNHIAKQMRKDGLKGITTASTYDAWTPARAYSHYHGGARILSETASARLASPVEIKYKDLRSRRGFDVNKESKTYSPLWMGGKWGMRDITNYMTSGAFHLLDHAAENRKRWLERFYKIGKDATRPRTGNEVGVFVIPDNERTSEFRLMSVLKKGGVEIEKVQKFTYRGRSFKEKTTVVRLDQPYGSFAKVMISSNTYPNLIDDSGKPIPPYDVTAHNLSLLFGAEAIKLPASFKLKKYVSDKPEILMTGPIGGKKTYSNQFKVCIYKSFIPSKDEGWTRWALEYDYPFLINRFPSSTKVELKSLTNPEINDSLLSSCNKIIFPDQSKEVLLEGYKDGSMPDKYVGGLKGKKITSLLKFVRNGGEIIFLNRSSDFAIDQFDLPVKNIVRSLKQKDFFIPGSILRIKFNKEHPIATRNIGFAKNRDLTWNRPNESVVWFERSPVFEVLDESRVKVIARYPEGSENILLSGWALGKERLEGKAAFIDVSVGRGKVILFGFRPQYRGQSHATFNLLFNAIAR